MEQLHNLFRQSPAGHMEITGTGSCVRPVAFCEAGYRSGRQRKEFPIRHEALRPAPFILS